ncbi:MAG: AI-2E family transporter [Bacteroidales bacterium]|nr:AI-2E family transporter [Bacteroidales bacterium]
MTQPNPNTPKMPATIIVAAIIIILAGMMQAASLVTQILLALFISIICAQPVLWLQKKKVPQSLAVAIVFVGIIGLFAGFGELIGRSLSSFSQNLPEYQQNLNQISATFIDALKSFGIDFTKDSLAGMLDASKVMNITAGFLGQLGGIMGNMFTIFFLVLFLLLELDSISIKTRAIVKGSADSVAYLDKIGKSIRHYLSIKTVTSLMTGVLIWIGLAIIGVDYAIIWGLIAFLLNYIPNIGSIIAAIPAVLFSIVQQGWGGVFWTSVVFVAVNMFIGNVVEPKMMGRGMGLSTFVVFLSLIFWGFIMGTVGMFLSVPLTMTIKIILEQNKNTRWFAIILGTEKDAQSVLEEDS